MQAINLVWLKRDLRLTDHTPLQRALSSERPTVAALYCRTHVTG